VVWRRELPEIRENLAFILLPVVRSIRQSLMTYIRGCGDNGPLSINSGRYYIMDILNEMATRSEVRGRVFPLLITRKIDIQSPSIRLYSYLPCMVYLTVYIDNIYTVYIDNIYTVYIHL